MKKHIQFFSLLLLIALIPVAAFAGETGAKIKVLVVTGGHPFEKEPFFNNFQQNTAITFTAAEHSKTNATVYEREDLLSYDVVVLYDMPKNITELQKARFMSLFDKGIGLVVLHHALASFQHWPEYEQIIGGRYPEAESKGGVGTAQGGYKHGQEVPVVIVAKEHPITAGLKDFTILDEIYWDFRVQSNVTPLVTTTNPQSGNPLGWCRTQEQSRVVYLQFGHDHTAYENPNYRLLLSNAIRWAAKR